MIGVGDYPHAKPTKGQLKELRDVTDLPSAADSAKFVCEWLKLNTSRLAAPLASIEVLISDPTNLGAAGNRFQWSPGKPVARASEANIIKAGGAWWNRLSVRPGDTALFYCCGHGAMYATQPVLFLEDLNRSAANPWSHLGLGSLAQSLRRNPDIGSAFLFADACGEFLSKFELGLALECRFFPPPLPFRAPRNNVALICAASETSFAYDGENLISADFGLAAGNEVRFGRFTQVLIKALGGASARRVENQWTVDPTSLLVDLHKIRRIFFDRWVERSFEHTAYVMPNDVYPIATFNGNFELPIVIITDPVERMRDCDLYVSEQENLDLPWLRNRAAGDEGAWLVTVPATRRSLYAIAQREGQKYSTVFTPEPLLKQLVGVQ
ncbi:hypothetical protein [Rhizobium sp. ZPR3]|uniref:Caspase family protein n=2 Tax=unclassified Rhizobium TaxID=2613769 RepID=A0AAU7SQR5_9HYPH